MIRSKHIVTCLLILCWQLLLISSYAHASQLPSNTEQSVNNSTNTPITVQLNWNHQYQFAGFYAAIKQGYYQQAGLDVSVKSWQPGVNVVDEVVSGRADFATGYSSVIADYAKGSPIRLVMVSFQFSPMVLLSHEPIYDLKQLSGKSLMHFNNMQINGLIDKANILVDQPIREVPSSGDLNDFINRKVDLYAAYKTNEPYRLFQKGVDFYTLDPKSFGIQSYGDLIFTSKAITEMSPDVVSAFKSATIRGWQHAITHQAEVVDFILANYPVKKDRGALIAEAEATTFYVKSGHNPVGHFELGKLLVSAEQAKESGLITQAQLDAVEVTDFVFNPKGPFFTKEERAYLKANPVIKLGNDLYYEPFEFVDERGQFQGMVAEYFQLFEKQLGVTFEINQTKSWSQLLDSVQQRELDVLSAVVVTEARQEYLQFTQPYLSFSMVLAADNAVSFIGDVDKLAGKKLAVGRGYWSHDLFKRLHPDIELVLVDSVQEGLEAVTAERAYAFAGNIAAINHTIKKNGLTNLHIAGQLGESFDLAIGVHKSNPLLFSILNKALASVSKQQRNDIYNNWIQLEVVNKTDRTVWIQTILIAVFLFTVLLVILSVLQIKKRAQQLYIDQINELSMATYTNMNTGKIEYVSERFTQLCGYDKTELLNQAYDKLKVNSVDDSIYQEVQATLMAGKNWQGELQGQRKDGSRYWADVVFTPEIVKGKVKGFWTTRTDITDKKNLQEIAIRDPLTGTFNRHHFSERFSLELKRASRKQESFAMASFDIDFFKQINDYYGHQQGDKVLKQVVEAVLAKTQRAGDMLFRVGGEEFMVFCEVDNQADFFNYLELLRESVEALQITNPQAPLDRLSISVGGVFCQRSDQVTESSLYAWVDKALYEAKNQGRNQVVMHLV